VPPASRLVIATDGSCLKNPGGAGGWAWATSAESWGAGGHPSTTNNLMELKAVYEALVVTPVDQPLLIESDSLYVIRSVSEWMAGWKRNGWQTTAKKPVANQSALLEIDRVLAGRDVEWRHVKGHNGHVLNEVCDVRAGAAAAAIRDGLAVDAGPGLRALSQ
jgi:ribonuclease HI